MGSAHAQQHHQQRAQQRQQQTTNHFHQDNTQPVQHGTNMQSHQLGSQNLQQIQQHFQQTFTTMTAIDGTQLPAGATTKSVPNVDTNVGTTTTTTTQPDAT